MRARSESSSTLTPHASLFVARQPIFDRHQRVFGYELLFREGLENFFSSKDVEAACRHTLDSSFLLGLDYLCGGAKVFLNSTRDALLEGFLRLLPPALTVVEILETVAPEPEVEQACLQLKAAGYLVALDDFVPGDPREPLAALADIIKLDLIATPRACWGKMAERYAARNICMLAEKVETPEEFQAARQMDFTYFQGYFFQKPVVLSTGEVPPCQVNYLRMLEAVHRPVLDWRKLEEVIKQEASLCYRLLRYLNSAAFGFINEIRSVRHALSMLGEREIRRWISLVATLGAGQNKPDELVQCALARGQFCESIGQRAQQGEPDCFLVGLLSLMDAILGVSMPKLLERVSVGREIKAALLGLSSRGGSILELARAQESGNWKRCSELAMELHLSEDEVSQAYLQSVRWAREVSRS